jgi:hypothetical protein
MAFAHRYAGKKTRMGRPGENTERREGKPPGPFRGLNGFRGREEGRGYNRRRSHKQQAASRPPQRKAKRERF